MKHINRNRVIELIKNSMSNEIHLFFIFIALKLLVFNGIMESSSIKNIALFASVVGTVLVLVCWTGLIPKTARLTFLYLIDIAVTLIIIADMLFYRYFTDVLSMNVLTQASSVTSVKSSVVSLLHISDLIFALDLFIIPLILNVSKSVSRRSNIAYRKRIIRFVFAFVIGFGLCSYGIFSLLKTQPFILSSFYDRVYIVQNIGLLSFHSIDAFKFVKSKDKEAMPVTEDNKINIREFLDSKKADKPQNPKLFGVGKDKNLIVIQVEALQEFVINRSISGQEITPNLNKLIKNSLYFDNYYTETAGGGTSDAELLSNASMFPAKEGSAYIRFSGNEYYSLAKRLKQEGYYASAMHAYKPGFWNRSVMYKTLGFDEFVNKNSLVQDEIVGMGLSDKSFFRQSLEQLEKYKEPYYSLLITLTSHYPFDNDEKYYSKFDVGEYKDTFLGNYLESIHYADEALGEFIEGLEASGIMERSVLAIYGDHFAIPKDKKEYLGEFLGLGVMDDFNWVKQQKVPLIIHIPGNTYKGTKHIAGGGVDFMPTILNVMGVDSSSMPMLGRDLLNSSEGIAILRHGYFITDKYICLTADGVAYDVKTGEKYPIEKLEKEKELARKSLEYSDLIIENNLVNELIEYLRK
ncbi:MAG TPA: LTA synthase family protein [Clostridia bacterium]|nr:LTA synthase family protein [Clostridia bacterium]